MTAVDNHVPHGSKKASRWIRQFHRWISMAFTLSVIASFIALALPEPIVFVSYVPLLPLFLLLGSGLYLFALPYFARWRREGTEAS
jgi:hypothetical protein